MSKKVTEMTESTRLNDSDLMMIVQESENKKIPVSKILDKFQDNFKPVQTTLTLNMDYFDNIDANQVVKSGNVVQVFFRAHTKQAIPNSARFATLPYTSIMNPTVPVSSERYGYTNLLFSWISANTKNWNIGAVDADKWIQASFAYITSD